MCFKNCHNYFHVDHMLSLSSQVLKSSLTPVINHKVPSPPCYALYLSFFRSSWLIITSWPDASWDFLVMDSSSASKRVFSLTSPSAAFSPKLTFSSKATHKMQLHLLLEVKQNINSIILWYVIYNSLSFFTKNIMRMT